MVMAHLDGQTASPSNKVRLAVWKISYGEMRLTKDDSQHLDTLVSLNYHFQGTTWERDMRQHLFKMATGQPRILSIASHIIARTWKDSEAILVQ
jgi:hypothetical protein